MATVFDTARYILNKEGRMSTWKLQKLCYYSQAWALAWTEKPLFDEDFQAWANGPVCPELFHAHRGRYMISAREISGDPSQLSADEIDTIDRVLSHYGSMEPYELREQSHSETPWIDARGGLPDGDPCSVVISKESMGEYYGSL